VADERRLLEGVAGLQAPDLPGWGFFPTHLAAHAVPPEATMQEERERYVAAICAELIPDTAARRLAGRTDVFMDQGALSAGKARLMARAAPEAGLALHLHVDQLTDGGGARLAAEVGAAAAAHLERTSPDGIAAMAKSGTIAVLLSVSTLAAGEPRFGPARALLEPGLRIAIASNQNPGTAPSELFALEFFLAAVGLHLSPQEILWAAARGTALAPGGSDQGILEAGAPVDLVLRNRLPLRTQRSQNGRGDALPITALRRTFGRCASPAEHIDSLRIWRIPSDTRKEFHTTLCGSRTRSGIFRVADRDSPNLASSGVGRQFLLNIDEAIAIRVSLPRIHHNLPRSPFRSVVVDSSVAVEVGFRLVSAIIVVTFRDYASISPIRLPLLAPEQLNRYQRAIPPVATAYRLRLLLAYHVRWRCQVAGVAFLTASTSAFHAYIPRSIRRFAGTVATVRHGEAKKQGGDTPAHLLRSACGWLTDAGIGLGVHRAPEVTVDRRKDPESWRHIARSSPKSSLRTHPWTRYAGPVPAGGC